MKALSLAADSDLKFWKPEHNTHDVKKAQEGLSVSEVSSKLSRGQSRELQNAAD